MFNTDWGSYDTYVLYTQMETDYNLFQMTLTLLRNAPPPPPVMDPITITRQSSLSVYNFRIYRYVKICKPHCRMLFLA